MEVVKQLLQKLKPIIGSREYGEWWEIYIHESARGKKEIEQYLQIHATKVIGPDYETITLLPPPPFGIAQRGTYYVGKILYGKTPFYKFNLKENDWLSHIVILGRTGSGKTNMVFHLISQLIKHNKPFWVFDFKRNYRDLLPTLPTLSVYTVGRDVSNITNFNPLVPIGDPHNHIRFIISLLCKTFYLGEGAHSLLIKCLDALYKNFGIYRKSVERYPTLRDVQAWLEAYKPRSMARDGQWVISTIRAIKVLNFGPLGDALNSQKPFPLKEYLGKRIVFELDALSKHGKIFLIGLLLYYRHTHKLSHAKREKLEDVLIIEEAHHLLPKKSKGEEESILEKLLREERELGTGVIIVDQLASRLSDVAFANTATTIVFNQKHRPDINTIANAILLDNEEKKLLSQIKIGSAIIRQQERWSNPFVVKIPLFMIHKGAVSDTFVKKHMGNPTNKKIKSRIERGFLDNASLQMLQSVYENPNIGIAEHYKKLQFGVSKGQKTKNILIEREFIEQINIKNKKGVISFLQLTKKGGFTLQLHTKKQVKVRAAGTEHEYYKRELAKKFKEKGYEVKVEAKLSDGSRPDILVNNSIAVEIETGKSKHWLEHIVLHLKSNRNVIVAVTNKEAYHKFVPLLKKHGLYPHEKVKIILPKI